MKRYILGVLTWLLALPALATDCINSGVTDQYTYFVAVDATDYVTRETGLSSFTVYRSRNGGAAAAFTTPTINETSSANMPGVYELLLDEDMTVDSGDDVQHMTVHITHAGMAPVTKEFCIARAKVTAGETLTVSSGNGNAAVQSVASNAITAASIASNAITNTKFATNAIDANAIAADAITSSEIMDGAITNLKFSSGAITATVIAADAIGASELAADAVTEIQSGLATASALATVDTVVDSILDDTGTTGVLISSGTGTGQLSLASGVASANAVQLSGDATAADNAESFFDGTGYAGTNNVIPTVTSVTNMVTANTTQISGDATAADNLEAWMDGTAGAKIGTGITDSGTLQAVDGSSAQLRSASTVGDDIHNGATILITSGTYAGLRGLITDYVGSTDTATVTWSGSVTPSGTPTYEVWGTAESSGGGGLDAAGVRAAIGMASANLDTQLGTIDTVVDAILDDTGTSGVQIPAGEITSSTFASGAITATVIATDAIGSDELAATAASEIGTATWATGTRTLTAGTNIVLAKGTGVTGFNDLSAAQVNAEVDTALGDYDGPTNAEMEARTLVAANYATAAALGTVDSVVDTIQVTTDKLDDTLELDSTVYRFTANALEQAPTGSGESLEAIADAVWDELLSGHAVSGSTGEALSNASAAGDPWATSLPGAYSAGTAGNILGNRLDAAVTTRASQSSLDTVDGIADSIVADTQDIQSRLPAALVSGRIDASVGAMAANTMTAAAAATDLGTELATATWASGTRSLTELDEDNTTIDLNSTAFGSGVSVATVGTVTDLAQTARADATIVSCEVNTANFAGSTSTLACILTTRTGSPITAASGDLTGKELLVLSGDQIYEARFINSSTWDGANSELRLTLSRALPGTLADAVTAVIR